MKKQVINLDDVPTKNDGKCDWYFFEATTSDGYANRAFGGLRNFSAITNTTKSLIWLLIMNKIKTKYNALALCKIEKFVLSTALNAIY